MLNIYYRGWKMEVGDRQAVATTKAGERLEIHKTNSFERSLRLIRRAVDRRENTCRVNLGKPAPVQAGAKEE